VAGRFAGRHPFVLASDIEVVVFPIDTRTRPQLPCVGTQRRRIPGARSHLGSAARAV